MPLHPLLATDSSGKSIAQDFDGQNQRSADDYRNHGDFEMGFNPVELAKEVARDHEDGNPDTRPHQVQFEELRSVKFGYSSQHWDQGPQYGNESGKHNRTSSIAVKECVGSVQGALVQDEISVLFKERSPYPEANVVANLGAHESRYPYQDEADPIG